MHLELLQLSDWGLANVHVTTNPVGGVSVKKKVKLNEQMLGFMDAEAAKSLEAARYATSPAIRWLPLLCATSGAHVGEMAQPRREDVIVVGTPQGMAHHCYPLRENGRQLHWHPLPCSHTRLAQVTTGPNAAVLQAETADRREAEAARKAVLQAERERHKRIMGLEPDA